MASARFDGISGLPLAGSGVPVQLSLSGGVRDVRPPGLIDV
jgi:hypothetical protein